MGVQIAAAKGADVTVLSRSLRKAKFVEKLGATRTLATSDDNFFRDHRGEFDFILNTTSAPIDVSAYLKLLKPRSVMACVSLPPEELGLRVGSLNNGSKVLAGSNIGGIPQTQEMLDFCAEHHLGAWVEKIGVDEVDAAYDRVVAGDVRFRFVIDTTTFGAV